MITPQLAEEVLQRLGLRTLPERDLAGLADVYRRWCRQVPFDNIQKRLFLAAGCDGPLPGHTAESFFRAWLAYGTGGTCWATSHGLYDLLQAVGFQVSRAACTMLRSPTVHGPNHGTVIVTLDGRRYVVDGAMLTDRPISLQEGEAVAAEHPAAHAPVEKRAGQWHVGWRPLHRPDGMSCRFDAFDVSEAAFHRYHEGTRAWSPFNYSVYARINTPDRVTGMAFGQRVTLGADGEAVSEALGPNERIRFLVEDLGMAEAIVARLPADEPLPPPPEGVGSVSLTPPGRGLR